MNERHLKVLRNFAILALAVILGSSLGCKSSSTAFSDALGSNDGGTGTASIAITSFSPASAQLVVKSEATQQFLVSAVGKGTLVYKWTLDGAEVGSQTSSYTLPSGLPVGTKALKLVIRDEVGTVSQEWSVKINGTPVVNSSTPTALSILSRRQDVQNYSVSVSDPNSDSLTYVWKLDGQEGVLTSTTSSQDWTPTLTDVGQHTVSVEIYDGPASDAGTYKVTRSWSTNVNHFSGSCNALENDSQTNKTCVFSGIAGIGDGLNPDDAPSSFILRPSALAVTSAGNLFVADDDNHVVWFWNKYTSPSINVLGIDVPVGKMKVVVGAGYPSSGNSSSLLGQRIFFNTIHGLAWDGAGTLYVSDTSNNRVVKVDSTGAWTQVSGGGCNSPRGLALAGGQLFIACYGSEIVRAVDTTTLVASTFAGTGAAGDPASTSEATFTHATNGRLRGPYGIAADSAGDIYVAEYSGCRVRVYNRATAGSKQIYGAGWTVSLNNQRIILGSAAASCGTHTPGEAVNLSGATDAAVRNLRSISFNSAGQLLMADNNHRLLVLNFASGSVTVHGTVVPGYSMAGIIGTGTGGYLGEGGLATVTRVNSPYDIVEDPISGNTIIADRDNRRLRRVNSSDNKAALVAGNGSFRNNTNSGQSTVEVGQERMNQPRGFVTDAVTGQTFVADSSNHRIRVISKFGEVGQAVGTGTSGAGGEEDELPTNSTMNQPRGLVLTNTTTTFGGHLVWADSQNHRIRIWNRGTAQATLFGVVIQANRVATIGGNGAAGNITTGSALQSAFNEPSGVAYDGTNLYVADRNNHCIKRIDTNGDLTMVAGLCGTAGNANGAVGPGGLGRMNAPEGIAYYSNAGHTGIVIVSAGNTRIRFFRLAGPSTLLFGTSIGIGDTVSVACGGTFHTEGVGASLAICNSLYDVTSSGNKFCFANSGYHNVRCVDPTGAITTVMGAVQGIDDATLLYFPGIPFSDATYSSTDTYPNYATQNGVPAFYLPSPLVDASSAPALNQPFGKLMYPRSVYLMNSTTLLVSDHIGTIRKVKLP